MSSLIREMTRVMKSLPPPPRFDRLAVRDLGPLAGIPRSVGVGALGAPLPPWMLGIPVVVDESVAVGVIELRKGAEVVDRVVLR